MYVNEYSVDIYVYWKRESEQWEWKIIYIFCDRKCHCMIYSLEYFSYFSTIFSRSGEKSNWICCVLWKNHRQESLIEWINKYKHKNREGFKGKKKIKKYEIKAFMNRVKNAWKNLKSMHWN